MCIVLETRVRPRVLAPDKAILFVDKRTSFLLRPSRKWKTFPLQHTRSPNFAIVSIVIRFSVSITLTTWPVFSETRSLFVFTAGPFSFFCSFCSQNGIGARIFGIDPVDFSKISDNRRNDVENFYFPWIYFFGQIVYIFMIKIWKSCYENDHSTLIFVILITNDFSKRVWFYSFIHFCEKMKSNVS